MKKPLIIVSIVLSVLIALFFLLKTTINKEKIRRQEQFLENLYIRCADLKGLGDLQIDVTTKDDIKKGNLRPVKGWRHHQPGWESYYKGYNDSKPFWGINDNNEVHWITENVKDIDRVLYTGYNGVKYDEIVFDYVVLAFLRDTLVAVNYSAKEPSNYDLMSNYKDRYGWGIGTSKMSDDEELAFSYQTSQWKNETVELDYLHDFKETEDDIQLKEYFLVFSRKRYPEFKERINSAHKEYIRMLDAKKNASLNSL